MKDSKPVYFLRRLSSSERKRFREYVASPYFNRREDVVTLLEVLEGRYISGKKGGEDEAIFGLVYKGDTFNKTRFKNLKTTFLNLLVDFMAQSEYQADTAAQNQYFLRKLNQTQEEKYFSGYFEKARTKLEKLPLSESDLFQERMALAEIYNEFQARQPRRGSEDHLQAAIDHLGNSFLIRMLKHIIHAFNREAILGTSPELYWLGQVMDYVQRNQARLPGVVVGYYTLYQVLDQPDSAALFNEMRSLLQTRSDDFSKVEALNLYTGTINFAARRLNDGEQLFLEEIYQLYREMLDRELLLDKDKISSWHFKNIVNVALRSAHFDWVETFIDEYEGRVTPDYNRNAFFFNRGMLHFYKQEFEVAERNFHRVLEGFKDVFYGINARAYLLQIFYETSNITGLESLAHSFRMFLDRNRSISPTKRRQNIEFILHLRKLVNLPLNDREKFEKLRNEIQEKAEKGMGSTWLLGKIEEKEQKLGLK